MIWPTRACARDDKTVAAGALLDIRNFSLKYGAVAALRNITLAIGKGEIVGVVGESGCGKSSLISSILRLLPVAARPQGGIFFKGHNLYDMSDTEMRDLRGAAMSVIFQDPMRAHNPLMRIGTQMTDIQYREKISRAEKLKRAADILRQVDIPEPLLRLRQYPHQFSGGMLQRIAIAMALLSRPDLLIADEPTTALDATLEVRIIDMLKQLQRDYGCSILFVSHHLGVIAELCQKVAVMYAGEVVEFGVLRDVFANPRHPYTRRLLECDPAQTRQAVRRLPTIAGEVPDLANLPAGCVFAPRCDKALAKCTAQRPPIFGGDGGHGAACWLRETAD